jgi:hypothetical protein
MAPLGALSQAWVSAEASLPLVWQIRGLWRFDDLWVALSEGPAFEDYPSGSGQYADPGSTAASGSVAGEAGTSNGRHVG